MPRRRLAWILACALGLGGCRTAEIIGREALRATPAGRATLGKWERYARLAKRLKTWHDRGALDDRDVLGVLYDFGVIKGRPAHLPGRPPRRPRSFPVPVYRGEWRWPLEAGVVSSEFGPRWGKQHHGLDLAADSGVPVFAAADGEVVYSGSGLRGYGNAVILQHDRKTTSLYAHNKLNTVKEGQRVVKGQTIASLGSTGRSTGPHVHFEIRDGEAAVDPRKRLPKSRF